MRTFLPLLLTAIVLTVACTSDNSETSSQGYPITPVAFTQVHLTDGFWAQRLAAARDVTIPLAFSKCEETGRYENFIRAAAPCDTFTVGGFSFDDTDVYKTIEGASYLMQTYPDPELKAYIDSVLVIVAAAQEPDGYLYTARTQNPEHPHHWAGSKRWEKVEELSHELYNLGHMAEAAVAHYQATGQRNFLDIAIRYADCVIREIGPGEGQVIRVPGHQIAEMGLVKLYLATGDRRYLDQAKFFLDQRGRTEYRSEYNQTHKPVTEQDEAVGHAVRAAYMYAGMADVAALTGDSAYIEAIDRIWDNIVGKKLYLTGGIGATARGEAFGPNYDLPNATAYCETCAAIGNVYVNHRLFLLHGDAKYYDVLERTLYNGLISGMSVDGGYFFYPNPLACEGGYEREPWFGCACCPSNLCRFIPSLPGYVYAVKDKDVYVNLYLSNTADLTVAGKPLSLKQQTNYPWDGDMAIGITDNQAGAFTLRLRLPGWAQGEPVPSDLYTYSDDVATDYSLTVNGEEVQAELKDGYLCIDRNWKAGDEVALHIDMQPRRIVANDNVEADRGRVAIQRGPLVYCAEHPDNTFDVLTTELPADATFQTVSRPDLLGGLVQLTTTARSKGRNVDLTLIPYYAWAHRGEGKMEVWMTDNN